jgi:hypothetical protein
MKGNVLKIHVNRFYGGNTTRESVYVNIEKISEILPVTLCSWDSSDIGDGDETNGVTSVIHMDNGFVYRCLESPEELLDRING